MNNSSRFCFDLIFLALFAKIVRIKKVNKLYPCLSLINALFQTEQEYACNQHARNRLASNLSE